MIQCYNTFIRTKNLILFSVYHRDSIDKKNKLNVFKCRSIWIWSHVSQGCKVYHGHMYCSMIYVCWMTLWVARQSLGLSYHALAGRRRPVTSGGVGVMTDGRAVMVGVRSGSPGGKTGPLLSSRTAGRLGYWCTRPRGRGRKGRRGRRDCGKWMHVGNSAFCHQTMGLWKMASAQYDQSSVDQDVMWLRLVSHSLCLFGTATVFKPCSPCFAFYNVFALTSFLLYCVWV